MGVRNRKKETIGRLNAKTLDARFLNEVQHGLSCSPFEGEAVLEVVKEVYFPFLGQYDRVRHCRLQGLSPAETAHILNSSLSLVEEYLAIDRELEGQGA